MGLVEAGKIPESILRSLYSLFGNRGAGAMAYIVWDDCMPCRDRRGRDVLCNRSDDCSPGSHNPGAPEACKFEFKQRSGVIA